MPAQNDKAAFKFAVITDTHIRSPLGDQSSPYAVNEKANGRARFAVHLLQQLEHEFVVHLGDMVHPLPHMDAYQAAADEAHRIFRPLTPDLYFVPGNHDSGDKKSDVSPAGAANAQSVASYEAAFARSHYCFEHQDILFIIINSSLINGEIGEEESQRAWLLETIAQAKGKRMFLFSHYPPFICYPDEAAHYDNYAEPGRHWLLDLAADAGIEAIISGHVHHFFINHYRGVTLYCLPATSFTRQDFSVLFRGSAPAEFGRDDRSKFGVTLFHVDPRGHHIEWVPTDGTEQEPAEPDPALPKPYLKIPRLIPSLRHSWYHASAMPANGPMEEFSRKFARNDYPILRLLQFGVETVRVPLADLLSESGADRMNLLHRLGLRFVVFTDSVPDHASLLALQSFRSAIHAVEIVSLTPAAVDVAALVDRHIPIWLSKITTSADQTDQSKPFAHTVTTGCLPGEMKDIAGQFARSAAVNDLTLVVQCPWAGEAMPDKIESIIDQWQDLPHNRLKLALNIRFAATNPAESNNEAMQIAQTIMAANKCASESPDITFVLDTFESFDRGYHPRLGLIDTLSNIPDWFPRQV